MRYSAIEITTVIIIIIIIIIIIKWIKDQEPFLMR